MIVLNVGGGSRVLPEKYNDWDQHLLDINPEVKPDLCMDSRELATIEGGQYDAVYSSHCLEHSYRHDVPRVLSGMLHVLKVGGFVEIIVPDLEKVMRDMLSRGLDIEDTYYRAGLNPISYHDVIYGFNAAMEKGNLYYAHKCGFTVPSLYHALERAGFDEIAIERNSLDLLARGTKCPQP
jgi:predicted SAM-dependent methyltransferase